MSVQVVPLSRDLKLDSRLLLQQPGAHMHGVSSMLHDMVCVCYMSQLQCRHCLCAEQQSRAGQGMLSVDVLLGNQR